MIFDESSEIGSGPIRGRCWLVALVVVMGEFVDVEQMMVGRLHAKSKHGPRRHHRLQPIRRRQPSRRTRRSANPGSVTPPLPARAESSDEPSRCQYRAGRAAHHAGSCAGVSTPHAARFRTLVRCRQRVRLAGRSVWRVLFTRHDGEPGVLERCRDIVSDVGATASPRWPCFRTVRSIVRRPRTTPVDR